MIRMIVIAITIVVLLKHKYRNTGNDTLEPSYGF